MLPAASTLEEITRVLTLARDGGAALLRGFGGCCARVLALTPPRPAPLPRPWEAQAGPNGHPPSAPAPQACMGHGWLCCLRAVRGGYSVPMAKAASSASAEPGMGSSIQDGPWALEKLSHGLVRAPPPSSLHLFPSPPRSPEERPLWHRPAWARPVPASPTLLPRAHIRE